MLLAAKHAEMVFFVRRIWLSLFHLLFLSDLTVVFSGMACRWFFFIFDVVQILLLSFFGEAVRAAKPVYKKQMQPEAMQGPGMLQHGSILRS